jgi:hypothetical protein
MWIEIESGVWVNMNMISDIRPRHRDKSATLFSCGVVVADSQIIYRMVFEEGFLKGK